MPAAIAALRAAMMQWVYLNTSSVLTASIAVVGVEGLAVIFEFSMLSPATLPFILLTLAVEFAENAYPTAGTSAEVANSTNHTRPDARAQARRRPVGSAYRTAATTTARAASPSGIGRIG